MKDDSNNCACNQCGIDADWSKDNGYKYVLDELKSTRAHIDEIIKVIEMRIEKDAIIDEVLNTDYPDDTQDDNKEKDDNKHDIDIDDFVKAIAIQKVLDSLTPYSKKYPSYWSAPSKTRWWL